jgi:hypothetical protein
MSFTVVPLHNLALPPGIRVEFGKNLVLQEIPDWVKKDELLKDLSRTDRYSVLAAQYAFVAEYEATSIGHPDPDWQGSDPKSIQEGKFQSAMVANLALWVTQPSPVCISVGVDAVSFSVPNHEESELLVQQFQIEGPLYCHPRDVEKRVSETQLCEAGKLYEAMATVPRNNPVWEALRAFWAALTMYSADRRYPFFWMGLESLFGPDDNTNEIGFRLAQRIAFFICDTPETAREMFQKVKKGYRTRSRIVHGRWKNDPNIDEFMADTEDIVREVSIRLFTTEGLLNVFIDNRRDRFLEDWVFSRSTSAPPLATERLLDG